MLCKSRAITACCTSEAIQLRKFPAAMTDPGCIVDNISAEDAARAVDFRKIAQILEQHRQAIKAEMRRE
jgi:hypothetical protein